MTCGFDTDATKGCVMEEIQRNFKGIWMPKEIYLSPDLTWTEKILFVEITSLCGDDGCFASNEYFAKFLGVGEWTISTGIRKLKAMGLIEQVSFDGRKRILKPKLDFGKITTPSCEKSQVTPVKNHNHNNIGDKKESKYIPATTARARAMDLTSYNVYELLRTMLPEEIKDAIKEQIVPILGAYFYHGEPPTDKILDKYIITRHGDQWCDKNDTPIKNLACDLSTWLKNEKSVANEKKSSITCALC